MQKYQETVISAIGRPVIGAAVRVTTLAGAAATIYSDNGITPIASLVTDSTGSFGFYAADGRYTVTISGSGFPARVIADVLLEDPVDEPANVVSVMGYVPSALRTSIQLRANTTDLTAYIQAAIDDLAVAGGGTLLFPFGTYDCNVILKAGVVLTSGVAGQFGYQAATPAGGVVLRQKAAGYVVDTPATSTLCMGLHGFSLKGLGAATAGGGVRFQAAGWSSILGVSCDNFADEGVVLKASTGACTVADVLTTNVVLNRSRSSVIGAVDIDGNDHFLTRLEAGISGTREGAVQSSNLYCCGIVLRGANYSGSSLIGEFSDIGIYFADTSSLHRFGQIRADLNFGHGFYLGGSGHQIGEPLGLNNSQHATNTYDNFFAPSTSSQNILSGPKGLSTTTKRVRYNFNDQVSSDTNKNVYDAPMATGAATSDFNAASFAGSAFMLPTGPFRSLTANSTTPSVSGYLRWKTANTVSTTITDFPGGVGGQELHLYCTDANTVIQHNGSTITTATGANKTLVGGSFCRFVKDNGQWRET